MCAPVVIESVREELSRRGFLKGVGSVIAARPSPRRASAVAQQKPVRLAKGFRDVHDLTHTFSPKTPVFPAFKPIQIRPKFSIAKDGFFANEITFDEHTGTHMDAPVHFVANAPTADRLPADKFFAPLAVISIDGRAAKDADALLTVDDVLAWEKQHGTAAGRRVRRHVLRVGRADRQRRAVPEQGRQGHDARAWIQRGRREVSRQGARHRRRRRRHAEPRQRRPPRSSSPTSRCSARASTASSCWRISTPSRRPARRSSSAHRSTRARPAARAACLRGGLAERSSTALKVDSNCRVLVDYTNCRTWIKLCTSNFHLRSTSKYDAALAGSAVGEELVQGLHRGRAVVAGDRFRQRVAAEERADDDALVRVGQLLHVVDVARGSCRRGTDSSRCSRRRTPTTFSPRFAISWPMAASACGPLRGCPPPE